MRYFLFSAMTGFVAAMTLQLQMQERTPASYGMPAPETRQLAPPLNGNVNSMKNIEDTYSVFLANEQRLNAEMRLSQQSLQQLLEMRSRQANGLQYINPTTPLAQAIRTEQNKLAEIKYQKDNNSMFAFHSINLTYASIQIGLKPESHQRVSELINYIMMSRFSTDMNSSVYSSYPAPTAPLLNTEPYASTMVDPLLDQEQVPQFPSATDRATNTDPFTYEDVAPTDTAPITTAI